MKQSASLDEATFTEEEIFRILDGHKSTATGLDGIPAWSLRLGAAIFAAPLAALFNLSISKSVVPRQWKQALICPIPKVKQPKNPSDFRPISITPVITRVMEKLFIKEFIYPAMSDPTMKEMYEDQFAFRPTGSTTASLIALLDKVTELLTTNSYVSVFLLDFSKAFDSVRHSTLLEKAAKLPIPDCAYNWLADFFQEHSHCTKTPSGTSTLAPINASVIQGSTIGPAAYAINASDLKPVNKTNFLFKFADDTDLVIPSSNESTKQTELQNISQWAIDNNLLLNHSKSAEIVFTRPRAKVVIPDPILGIPRVNSIKTLGVTLSNNFSMQEHVTKTINSCAQSLYALKMLRSRGLNNAAINVVFQAVVLSKLMYASPAWSGFAGKEEIGRINSFLNRCAKYSYTQSGMDFEALSSAADDKLFASIVSNDDHVLHRLLPQEKSTLHNLRKRKHNFRLPSKKDTLIDKNFFIRMLYK